MASFLLDDLVVVLLQELWGLDKQITRDQELDSVQHHYFHLHYLDQNSQYLRRVSDYLMEKLIFRDLLTYLPLN
jgi:hypothetical protein